MKGIDVSNVNGRVNWAAVRADGVKFAWVKATEGLTYNDSNFPLNRAGATAQKIPVGAYHFARPDLHPGVVGAVQEADHFCLVVGKIRSGELRPALDFEHAPADAKWAEAWLKRVWQKLGVQPVFYSYPSFLNKSFSILSSYPLWLASYGPNDGNVHPYSLPVGWKKLVAHQYSSRGRVHGVSGWVDLNEAVNLSAILAAPPAPAVLPPWYAKFVPKNPKDRAKFFAALKRYKKLLSKKGAKK